MNINAASQGILVVGALDTDKDILATSRLAAHLNWPILNDITAPISSPCVIEYVEETWRHLPDWKPDYILQLGSRLNSKQVLEWLAKTQCTYIQVHPSIHNEDPLHQVTHKIVSPIDTFCDNLIKTTTPKTSYSELFIQAEKIAIKPTHLIYTTIKTHFPSDAFLFCGNSLAIRMMNRYAKKKETPIRVLANRGASGIDGLIATAIGTAVGKKQRCIALLGDLSALHDLNSFSLLPECPVPITFIILNNNGGGIFSELPIATSEHFIRYFKTPHGYTFKHIAKQFNIDYLSAEENTFSKAFCTGITSPKTCIIEVNIS